MPYTLTLSHMESAIATANMPLLGLQSGHFFGTTGEQGTKPF
eukprot:CAMPEP_0177788050 /NCGR_PEP_ID=MMETSP0491_2-20121128/21870_1 /TAXON_ID=63592 /ORGANISM="Tetraselmis chuii, Strain PLY429" /LENGTH=41 /DNA_ID= /DNA_START= /DNA_END= /DNA_ORIENTATION=